MRYPLALLLIAAVVALAACGSARRGAPLTGPHEPPNAEVAEGQRTFDRFCNGCHPGGAAGVGLALNNKPLPGFVIRRQVRWGLGAMPAFSEETISDQELDNLVAYLVWLRRLDRKDDSG